MIAEKVEKELKALGSKERAVTSSRFFKTGEGQYGGGDIFRGVTVPATRTVVKKYLSDATVEDVVELLQSKYHESRLAACMLFVEMMRLSIKKNDEKMQRKIFTTYMKNATQVNNWDLVDTSASAVVGYYISEKMEHEERLKTINKLIKSKNLWENRIIVVATHYQIKKGNEKMLYYVAEHMMGHKHDLMHKAIGWMLREVGKYSGQKVLNEFLDKHAHYMPRTSLRYALEHHGPEWKKKYMDAKKRSQ